MNIFNNITLPPMPKLEDFPHSDIGYDRTMYLQALNTWERICKEIIDKAQREK